MKKISVVIPIYNSERTLSGCLQSIFSSDYKNFEVIVVNDCSSDKSVEIAREYPCKIMNLTERRGPAFARDKGLSLATGEIVAFLDSDCLAPKDWLDKINTKLTGDLVGVGGKYILPEDGSIISNLFMTYWDLKNIFYRNPRGLISLSGGNCAFWKSALMQKRDKKELVYCDKRVGSDDTIMCHELRRLGKLIYDPGISVIHEKKSGLSSILKESISLGFSGAITTGFCGSSLIKEPHRIYKTLLYLFSVSVCSSAIISLFTNSWSICFYMLIFYIIAQLPLISSAHRYLPRPIWVLFLPIIILVADLSHFIGYAKRIFLAIGDIARSAAWHIKFVINIVNPFALSRLFFFVTKECNASCYFCFNRMNEQRDKKEDNLSWEEIRRLSEGIGFLPWLTITGGEPFLRKDIHDICKLFYANCGTRIISIVTNATPSSYIEETAERLLLDFRQLSLTIIIALDDIGDRHDRIKGVKDCYRQALGTLEKLAVLALRFPKLTLGINTMIIQDNANRIEEVLGYFSDNLKFDKQYLNLPRQPACTSIDQKLVSLQKYFNLLKAGIAHKRSGQGRPSVSTRFRQALLGHCYKKSLEEFRLGRALDTCLAAQKFFVIDNNGDVFACELLPQSLGNLRNAGYEFKRIMHSPQTKKVKLKIKNTRCYCQWPCAIAINGYSRVSAYPKIIKGMMDKGITPKI